MRVLIDTNVMVAYFHQGHVLHSNARIALHTLYRRRHLLCLTLQNLTEFWNVSTRPVEKNGMEWGVRATQVHLRRLERFCTILPDSYEVIEHWRRLVVIHAVVGKKVHDARLVAVMRAYDIKRIVTFNGSDFNRYPHIDAVHPKDALSAIH